GVHRAGRHLIDVEAGRIRERRVAEDLAEMDIGRDTEQVVDRVLLRGAQDVEELALEAGRLIEVRPAVTAVRRREAGRDRDRHARDGVFLYRGRGDERRLEPGELLRTKHRLRGGLIVKRAVRVAVLTRVEHDELKVGAVPDGPV